MTPSTEIAAPNVRCFSGRQHSFIQFGGEWHRMTPEDSAKFHTGFDRETRESSVGIYLVKRPNGLMRIGFDLWRIDVNLRPEVVERLGGRWRAEVDALSKSMLRNVLRRAHFSKSFAQFEVQPERLEEWKAELMSVLSNADSYEAITRRTTDGLNQGTPSTNPESHEQL